MARPLVPVATYDADIEELTTGSTAQLSSTWMLDPDTHVIFTETRITPLSSTIPLMAWRPAVVLNHSCPY
jgi:hypothetical protein